MSLMDRVMCWNSKKAVSFFFTFLLHFFIFFWKEWFWLRTEIILYIMKNFSQSHLFLGVETAKISRKWNKKRDRKNRKKQSIHSNSRKWTSPMQTQQVFTNTKHIKHTSDMTNAPAQYIKHSCSLFRPLSVHWIWKTIFSQHLSALASFYMYFITA